MGVERGGIVDRNIRVGLSVTRLGIGRLTDEGGEIVPVWEVIQVLLSEEVSMVKVIDPDENGIGPVVPGEIVTKLLMKGYSVNPLVVSARLP